MLNEFKVLSFSSSQNHVYTFGVSAASKLNVLMHWLKYSTSWQVNSFTDLTAIDLSSINTTNSSTSTKSIFPRFLVTYFLTSFTYNCRVILISKISEKDILNSFVSLFDGANWSERELFEMFGIKITGHPDLRRLLSDYGFIGFPLRKDFPLSGFRELFYREDSKRVSYSRVEIPQEFRSFRFITKV